MSEPFEVHRYDFRAAKCIVCRFYWGELNGWWDLKLWDQSVNIDTIVFASATEVWPPPGERETSMLFPREANFGAATYTIHNISTFDGGINLRLHIDWDTPLRTRVDYLWINRSEPFPRPS